MEKFATMKKAAELAVTRAVRWRFAYSSDIYDNKSLVTTAKMSDSERLGDEDSFYTVSNGGAIGFSEDGQEIEWLFLPEPDMNEPLPKKIVSVRKVSVSPPAESPPAESPPIVNQPKFCFRCGSPITPGARFCGKCGAKLFE